MMIIKQIKVKFLEIKQKQEEKQQKLNERRRIIYLKEMEKN